MAGLYFELSAGGQLQLKYMANQCLVASQSGMHVQGCRATEESGAAQDTCFPSAVPGFDPARVVAAAVCRMARWHACVYMLARVGSLDGGRSSGQNLALAVAWNGGRPRRLADPHMLQCHAMPCKSYARPCRRVQKFLLGIIASSSCFRPCRVWCVRDRLQGSWPGDAEVGFVA